MKIQKHKTREVKGKEYYKYIVVIPNDQVEGLGWKEGENLNSEIRKDSLVLSQSKNKTKEKVSQ